MSGAFTKAGKLTPSGGHKAVRSRPSSIFSQNSFFSKKNPVFPKKKTKKEPWLSGFGEQTKTFFKFGARRVEILLLKDAHSGAVIGTSYPTKQEDTLQVTKWAGVPKRTSDVSYLKNLGAKGKSGKQGKTGKQERVPSPWAGSQFFYTHAHANKKIFAVSLKATKKQPAQKVLIDGATYARLLARSPFLRKFFAKNPTMMLVMLSCSVAHPEAVSGKTAVEKLRELGFTGDVFAPSGKGTRLVSGDERTSRYGVQPDTTSKGEPVPGEFVGFPGTTVRQEEE
ncbi:hypothetical protein JOF56_009513 [Kibdelosporangium banguiense]|uniref:Uncharacterized protein n=1 Tax=Kibdelosporangium banguiense TaxID=1365924 RepID=A0ABS4TXN5_9PSEU|nr:hypothetical protein [Kibdelosporangium banguiense]MBP2329128.1 hypothetical protein [Kibdelosporangium banguiense]